MLTATLGQNPMLWRTSPIGTELEEVVVDWLRQALGLPDDFDGLLTDTASTSTLIALAAAREAAGLDVAQQGLTGRPDLPALRVYASAEAHSSIEKACMTLGLGRDALVRDPDERPVRAAPGRAARRRSPPTGRRAAADRDRRHGRDDVVDLGRPGRGDRRHRRARGAVAARRFGVCRASSPCCRSAADRSTGWERADSIVVNPHKWLFTPLDASLLLTRRMDGAARRRSASSRSTCARSTATRRSATTTSTRRSSAGGSARSSCGSSCAGSGSRGCAAGSSGTSRWRRVRGRGRRRPGLGAAGARPVLDGLLPLAPARLDRVGRGARRRERRDHGRRQSDRRGLPLAYAARRPVHDPRRRSGTCGPRPRHVERAWALLREAAAARPAP